MKILHLPLKAKWYNMIESGVKQEEYRDLTPYWLKRLFKVINMENTHYEPIDKKCAEFYCLHIDMLVKDLALGGQKPKGYTHVIFRYGYTKRTMLREIESITIGKGNTEWGAPTDKQVFIIKFKSHCCY